jgi:hypothetical protein
VYVSDIQHVTEILPFALYTIPLSIWALQSRPCLSYCPMLQRQLSPFGHMWRSSDQTLLKGCLRQPTQPYNLQMASWGILPFLKETVELTLGHHPPGSLVFHWDHRCDRPGTGCLAHLQYVHEFEVTCAMPGWGRSALGAPQGATTLEGIPCRSPTYRCGVVAPLMRAATDVVPLPPAWGGGMLGGSSGLVAFWREQCDTTSKSRNFGIFELQIRHRNTHY